MKRSRSIRGLGARVAALVGMAAALWGLPAAVPTAEACGGFFCSVQTPVDQSAENIIFVHDEAAGEVTAVIQIFYQGPSDSFAWLLPVPGIPKVGVSSNIAFQNLRQVTDPQYNLQVEVEGTCMDGGFLQGGGPFDATLSPSAGAAEDSGVTVLDEGSVGPYVYVTISLNPALADPADAAVNWLTTNGYDVTAVGPEVLGPYLADGLNLIAFKLTKGNDAGTIRPVVITYESDLPMIPIRPTRVAAVEDMGVRVWMVAAHQAIPKNYKSLVLNEALINWFCWSCNYDDVVSAAADEAGGQGFTTELAAPSSDYEDAIFGPSMLADWQSYMATPFVDGFDAITQASWRYRGWDGWREAVCDSVALPVGVSCDAFGANPDAYRAEAVIDETAFLTSLYEGVIKPVMDAQALLVSQPYLTRLYSTMSPEEMTLDPLFDINSDLGDISNIHTARQVIECSPDVYQWDAPWRIELPQGGVIRGTGSQTWPIDLATTDLPANHKIVQLTTSGAGMVITDNTEMITASLFDMSGMTSVPTVTAPDDGVMIGGNPDPTGSTGAAGAGGANDGAASDGGGGGFCSTAAPGAGAGPMVPPLLAFGLLLLGRRRRRG